MRFYDPRLTYEENFERGPAGPLPHWEPVGPPTQDFFGIPVYEPFGIAAGPLLRGSFVLAAHRAGYDLAVYKTVRSRPHPCYPWPNMVEVPPGAGSWTNSFGVPSQSPGWWISDMEDTVGATGPGRVTLASFQGDDPADWGLTARLVALTGAGVLVANVSCPNLGNGPVCFDLDYLYRIVTDIRQDVPGRVLLLKLAYNPDPVYLDRLALVVGPWVDGVIAVNAIPERTGDLLPGRAVSGVCGPSIRERGLVMVRELAARGLKVVGCGGVASVEDYVAYRQAGAVAVLAATGPMLRPGLGVEIKMAQSERSDWANEVGVSYK